MVARNWFPYRSAAVAAVTLLVNGAGSSALAAEGPSYSFGTDSVVTYLVSHPMHHVEGVSHMLLGNVRLAGDGTPDLAFPVKLYIPISTFTSGSRNRDRNMLETMNAARYPNAMIVLNSAKWTPQREGTKLEATGTAVGTLTLHGATHPVEVPLKGFIDGERLEVDGSFSFSCSDYGIERPSLLFRPIDDQVKIELKGIAHRQ